MFLYSLGFGSVCVFLFLFCFSCVCLFLYRSPASHKHCPSFHYHYLDGKNKERIQCCPNCCVSSSSSSVHWISTRERSTAGRINLINSIRFRWFGSLLSSSGLQTCSELFVSFSLFLFLCSVCARCWNPPPPPNLSTDLLFGWFCVFWEVFLA